MNIKNSIMLEMIKRHKDGLCPICKRKLHKDEKTETTCFKGKLFTVCSIHFHDKFRKVENGRKMRTKIRQTKESS